MASKKRSYQSEVRQQAAQATRARIVDAARKLFARNGVDPVTVADISQRAEVGQSTIYALFGSKAGILRELMREAIFNARYQSTALALEGVTDPGQLLVLTARIARSIYEGEAREAAVLRGASAFSKDLRKLESEFEDARYDLQHDRVALLHEQKLLRTGLDKTSARDLLWTYTSRDIYRMLVLERGWTADRYEDWLGRTLKSELLQPGLS